MFELQLGLPVVLVTPERPIVPSQILWRLVDEHCELWGMCMRVRRVYVMAASETLVGDEPPVPILPPAAPMLDALAQGMREVRSKAVVGEQLHVRLGAAFGFESGSL